MMILMLSMQIQQSMQHFTMQQAMFHVSAANADANVCNGEAHGDE